jgi:hypothetical protein
LNLFPFHTTKIVLMWEVQGAAICHSLLEKIARSTIIGGRDLAKAVCEGNIDKSRKRIWSLSSTEISKSMHSIEIVHAK